MMKPISDDPVEHLFIAEINDLLSQFKTEKVKVQLFLKEIKEDQFESVVPFTCYGIDTRRLNSLTIQLGLVRKLHFKYLELKERQMRDLK